ncbi:MAG: dnaQ, partial [Devosia sp.]|nr:dnaQ [Devosia sp.]
LELIGGRQAGLALVAENRISGAEGIASMVAAIRRPVPLPSRVSAEAAVAHAALIATMGADALWNEYAQAS